MNQYNIFLVKFLEMVLNADVILSWQKTLNFHVYKHLS